MAGAAGPPAPDPAPAAGPAAAGPTATGPSAAGPAGPGPAGDGPSLAGPGPGPAGDGPTPGGRTEPGARRRPRGRGRDRRGRGLRGRLVPASVPLSRTRSEQFDDLVLDAVEHLEERWSQQLAGVEFAVEDVPDADPDPASPDGDPVPLARLVPAEGSGQHAQPARIVVYRRPLEARAADREDLADLVLDVVVHEVAHLLDLDVEVVDPEGHGGDDEDDE